jgi:hypothetical protein
VRSPPEPNGPNPAPWFGPHLTGLEEARDHDQRDERPHQARDPPLARACSPSDLIRDRHRTQGNHRVDEMKELAGATATCKDPKASGHAHDEREDEEPLEAFGRRTAR